jgi:cobalamin-dependent methionine synthase I
VHGSSNSKTKNIMNKIIEKLLTVTFPNVNIANLLEIVSATPNPTIATEILCGLYEEVKFPSKVRETSSEKRELTFKSYDKWNDKVSYSYTREKTISGYFPENTVKEDITLVNFKERQQDWKSGANQVCISLKTGEAFLDTSSCSSQTWLGYTNLDY